MDAVLLARVQFALTIGFHLLFPPISIGLAWVLVFLEYRGWRRQDPHYVQAGKFFGGLFALIFALGVASGIVMEFQFGTNWATYSRFVGDIFGAPLAAEGVLAFFLESCFLGLYLFGRGRVSPRLHWLSILLVALGATLSAFWIIAANSWQQTPAGYRLNHELGRAELTSFYEAVFNPSTLVRYVHTLLASLVSGTFVVAGIAAYLLLRDRGTEVATRALKTALPLACAGSLLLLFPSGHEHAAQVARTQPEKLAVMEGLEQTTTQAPLLAFAIPAAEPPHFRAKIEIPGLLSWMAFGDRQAEVRGMDAFPRDELPPLLLTFASFHTMVGLGSLFILLTGLGAFLWWRGRLLTTRPYLWALVLAAPLPVIACQLGWITAEVGRQPWVVYKLLRTADAVSVTVPAGHILASIILFVTIYLLLFAAFLFLLRRKLQKGPGSAQTT